MLQRLIIHFLLHYLPSGRLPEVKNKEIFKLLALKVALKTLIWYFGRLGKVVAAAGSTIQNLPVETLVSKEGN